MGGPSGAAESEDAKYIYIKAVGEEPVAAAVFESKMWSIRYVNKESRRWYSKNNYMIGKVNSMFYIYQCKIQSIVLQK